MPDPQRPHPLDDTRRRGAAALAVVALLAIVGMGAAGALHDDPDADRTAANIATFPLLVLLGAAAAAAVMQTILARKRMARDPEDVEEAAAPGSRWLRLALFLLPLAIAGALIVAIALRPPAEPARQRAAERPGAVPRADTGGGGGNPWQIAAFAAGAIAVVGAFGYAARRARPRRASGLPERRPPDPAAAVDDALAALEHETDPRRAIIAAYVRMEHALDRAGLGRREPEAPREYLARVAGALRGDVRAARRLTTLYEEARFSVHPMDDGMRADAVEALRALRAEGTP